MSAVRLLSFVKQVLCFRVDNAFQC